MVGGELPDAHAGLLETGEPQRSEADPRGPALRPFDKQFDVLHAHRNADPLDKQLACLLAVERDLVRAQLPESAPCP